MGDDLQSFIETQKRKLEQERNQLTLGYPVDTKTADQRNQSQASGSHPSPSKFMAVPTESDLEETGLKLGGYAEKQKKLREERAQEYKKFLAEKNMRSTGNVDAILSQDVSPTNSKGPGNKISPRESVKGDRFDDAPRGRETPLSRRRGKENRDDRGRVDDDDYYDRAPRRRPESYYDPYEELLRQKRMDERRYRRRYDDYEDDRPMRLNAPQYKYSSRSDGILNKRYDDDYDDYYSPRRRDGRGNRDRYDSKRVRFLESRDYDDYHDRPPRVPRFDSYNDDDDRGDLVEKARSRSRRRNSAHERHKGEDDILGLSSESDKPRSHSAPLVEGAGIFAGMSDPSKDKQKKQSQYKQELQAQIKEREEKKKREKLIKLGRLDDVDSPNKPDTFSFGDQTPAAPQQQISRKPPQSDPYKARTQAFEQPTSFLGPYNDDLYSGLLGGLSDDPLSGYDRAMGGLGGETGYTPSFGLSNNDPSAPTRPRQDNSYGQPPRAQGVGNRSIKPPGGQVSGGETDSEAHQNKIAKQREYQEQLHIQMKQKEAEKQKAKQEREKYEKKLDEEVKNYNPWGRGGAGAPIKDSQGLAVTDLRTMHQFNQEGKIVSPRDPPPPVDTRFKLDLQQDQTDFQSEGGFSTTNASPYARANTFKEEQPQNSAKQQAQEEYKEFLKRQVEEKQKKKKEEDDQIRKEEEREQKRLEEQRLKMQKEYEEEKEKQRLKEEETQRRNEEIKAAAEAKRQEAERRKKEMEEERQNELRRKLDEKLAAQRNKQNQLQQRVDSPVIPTLRAKEEPRSDSPPLPAQQNHKEQRSDSPPLAAQQNHKDDPSSYTQRDTQAPQKRYRSPPLNQNRAESLASIRTEPDQDVLSQLTALKQQLKNEEMKIQNQMQNNKMSSTRNRSTSGRRVPKKEVDIFDRAVLNKAPPSRKNEDENYSPAEEFNKIKYGDATSLAGDFRSQYPEPASSGSVLDLQQQAYLRAQEDKLSALRAGLNEGRPGPSNVRQNGHLPRPGSKTSLLDSDSKFLTVDDNQEIDPPSFDPPTVQPRQPSARERRRWKHLEDMAKSDKPYGMDYKPPTPGGFSLNSVTSFNIDEVALKNEARLRKLERLRGPGSTHDPDELLKRFVTDHNRPESTISGGSLLDTDTIYHPL